MLLPAFCAILLSLFVFKDSPIYRKNYVATMQADDDQAEGVQLGGRKVFGPRWFFYAYLVFTLVYAVMGILALALPEQATTISAVGGGINILMLIVLVVIRALSGKKVFDQAGLKGGKPLHWLLYGLAFVLFYGFSTALNAAFNLGQPSDPVALLEAMSGGQQSVDMPLGVLRMVLFVQTVVAGPLLGLIMGFGEEYGWRSYLQGELVKLGKVRGVLLLGVIWGVWHYPVIWMGHNYPGYPVWGSVVMTGYTVLLGFVLGYVMLKTKSIWLVAFLHAINNQVLAFFTLSFYQVETPLFSFGIGVYGLLTMVPIVALLLRDKIWRTEGVTA
jgi:membrane protease YdiL (CAAX protease family)